MSAFVEPLVVSLVERGWTGFFFASGIAIFGALAAGFGVLANATCTTAMYLALFGGSFVGTGPCLTAAGLALVAGSISAGLVGAGAQAGWTFEGNGFSVRQSRRSTVAAFQNNRMGLTHNYDADTHRMLNRTYGSLLQSHNTSIITVTWLETQPNFNHTGKPTENLNMTSGRLISLKDHTTGYIHTGLGQTTDMGGIILAFSDFKTSQTPGIARRQSSAISFASYTTYGENMQEGSEYYEGIEQDSISEGRGDEGDVFDFGVGGAPTKYCLSAGPPNEDQPGLNSIIVGEVYMNQFGGLDTECQSG